MDALEFAVRLRPDHVGALANVGLLLESAGAAERASRYLADALRVVPHSRVLYGVHFSSLQRYVYRFCLPERALNVL